MSSTEEATVNPDGSTTFSEPVSQPLKDDAGGAFDEDATFEQLPPSVEKGIDPAFYLLGVVLLLVFAYCYFFVYRKKDTVNNDDFFSNLDGEKFNLKLPSEVNEYYQIRAKCEQAGWEPGQKPEGETAQQSGPHRILAQALMKRAIADIPIVQHIQKESTGMNKLYSQSMCSVKQWRAYQSAEQMVSGEVEDVRAEADEIEPGWAQVIWRQAMQYHQMLKQKHEQEAKQVEDAARKRKQIEENVKAARAAQNSDPKAKEIAAQRAAEELIKEEERAKDSKKAFSGGVKKGFLDASAPGKKGKKK